MNQHDKSIHDVQEELLYALVKIHEYCINNQINYSLHGGTLIGAVREHGFIDWDDDADISMTRENYEKFLRIYREIGMGKELYFDEIRRKIYISRENKPHVWVDLFIYDYITDNKFLQKVKIAEIAFGLALIRTPEMLKMTKIRGMYKGWKYGFIWAVSKVGQIFPEDKKFRFLSKLHKSFPGKRNLIHRANDQFRGVKQILPNYIMDAYYLVPFENTELMITRDYDIVLRTDVGDYMTPVKVVNDVNAHHAARNNI